MIAALACFIVCTAQQKHFESVLPKPSERVIFVTTAL